MNDTKYRSLPKRTVSGPLLAGDVLSPSDFLLGDARGNVPIVAAVNGAGIVLGVNVHVGRLDGWGPVGHPLIGRRY